MKPTTFYLLPAILLLAMIACSDPDEPISDADLMAVVWIADSLQTPDIKIFLGPDTLLTAIQANDTTRLHESFKRFITIQFMEDMQISLSLFCNDCGGTYEIAEKGYLSILAGGCTEAVCGALPERYLRDALDNVTAYTVVDSALTLYNEDRSYIVIFSPE